MFTDNKLIRRLMKEEYKGLGLFVGDMGETYVIRARGITIEVDKKALCKEVKAQIIELAGELPFKADGQNGYMCAKGCPLQYEVITREDRVWIDAPLKKTQVEMTNLLAETNGTMRRIVRDETGKHHLIMEKYAKAVDPSAINEECETAPAGPFIDGKSLYWWNNSMGLRADLTDPDLVGLTDMIEVLDKGD